MFVKYTCMEAYREIFQQLLLFLLDRLFSLSEQLFRSQKWYETLIFLFIGDFNL